MILQLTASSLAPVNTQEAHQHYNTCRQTRSTDLQSLGSPGKQLSAQARVEDTNLLGPLFAVFSWHYSDGMTADFSQLPLTKIMKMKMQLLRCNPSYTLGHLAFA